MNSSVVIALDTRREKSDKTFPIALRLIHFRKMTSIATGFSVPMEHWNENTRKIKTGYKGFENVTRVNNLIEKEKLRALDIITKLHDRGELASMSITDLKSMISAKGKTTFFEYAEKQIAELKKMKRIGNARNYSNILREVKKFRNEVDFPFRELNFSFLKKFESYYLKKGLGENGLSVYTRGIRAIFNKAINDKLIEKDAYPFDQYTITSKPTKKRAISFDAIQKIVKLKFKKGEESLAESRNMFLMSFYMMGAPFIDLAFLTAENIVDGRIQYRRRKTGKFFDIKITDNLKPILDHYARGKTKDQFLLPIIKRVNLEDQYKDIQWAQKRYNKRLKTIADKAGIQEKLTSYVSRHSFASIANNMAVPVTAISEMLGHQRLTTTQVYLAGLQKDTIDRYNETILSGKSN